MMHTKFSGSNGQNAHRWLRTLRFENPHFATVSPSDWLGIVDGLLEGDAATWADHHPRAKHILRAGSLKQATRADVETFKKAFIARFPPVEVKIDHSRPTLNISSPILMQAPNEDLDSYYQRTLALLYQRNGVDLAEAPLTEQEQNALKRTVMSYIVGLNDSEIRREADKVWTASNSSLSLHHIHKLSKDRMMLRWFGGKENFPETRLPGQAAKDQTPNRANVPGSSFDNPAFRSYMENVSDPDNLPRPNNPKFATGAGDRRNIFDDLYGDPTLRYRPFPESFPRRPTDATASPWNQPQKPPPETGFTSRMGNSHHTPNTSYGSNLPATDPTSSMFGGATGSPFRPQSSRLEDLPAYSIFDAGHAANRSAARFFANGTGPGANNDNPPHHYPGMPPSGLSPFDALPKNPTSSLFGDGPAPGRASKGTSPNRHSRRPNNLDVEIDHIPPSRLSEDTVRQFYSPNRNIFGNFSSSMQSPGGGVSHTTANPSSNNTAANNASATTSHHNQAPSIQVQTPSIFNAWDINFPGFEDRPTRHDSNDMNDFMRHFPEQDNHPSLQATDPPHERHGPKPPFESVEDALNQYFPHRATHLSPQTTNPPYERLGPSHNTETLGGEYTRKFSQRQRDNHSSSQPTSTPPNNHGPNPPYQSFEDAFPHRNNHPSSSTLHPPAHNTHNPTTNPNTNNPFQTSMDSFTREFSRLDTSPPQDVSPVHDNPFPSPRNPNAHTPLSPSPLSYSQTLLTTATNTANAPPHPTVESDSEPDVEIPITIKQSQGKKKRRRRQKKAGDRFEKGSGWEGDTDADAEVGDF